MTTAADNRVVKKRERSAGVCAPIAPARARLLALVVVVVGLVACSPTFDWREARPLDSGAALMFPCRPDRHERMVVIGTATLRLQLSACTAGKATFSLATADAGDAAQVGPLLSALRSQAIANLGGMASELPLPAIAGATQNPHSARLRIVGKRPDGRPVVAHAAFFVKGLRLYQATVLDGDEPTGAEALETFFASIRLS